jgi:hypothetical protein
VSAIPLLTPQQTTVYEAVRPVRKGLTFPAVSATVHLMITQVVRPDWFYAFYFTPPVLSAGEEALTARI